MTDSGLSRPLPEHSPMSLRTRPRSASEAIRKRVNQRLATTGDCFEPPELIQTSCSAQFTCSKPELRVSPNREPQSAKRKKASRDNYTTTDPNVGSSHSQRMGRPFIAHSRRNSEQIDESSDDEPTIRRPIAATEIDRLRKEVDALKEALHEGKKSHKRQTKKYEEAKAELNSTIQTLKGKESELSSLKDRHTKREELISTIESSVQCQICMDLPDRPFALAPCGHILCLACLQEWFRKAPPTLDDIDIDPEELTDPRYILMRSKSCPTCRTMVKHRPVPVFMVRAIAGALRKAKLSTAVVPQSRAPDSHGDPWKGIFPSSDEETDDANEHAGSSTEQSDSDSDQLRISPYYFRRRAVRRAMFRAMYISTMTDEDEDAEDPSDSDDEEPYLTFVRPRWTPPSVDVDPTLFDISEEQDPVGTFKLLQRGCTWDMIQGHDISYHHSSGIVLRLRSLDHLYASDDEEVGPEPQDLHSIYLGWNIALDEADVDGEAFICSVIEDIKSSPFRWEVTPRDGVPGALDAMKLVLADEAVDYHTTDTEVWMDSDDF